MNKLLNKTKVTVLLKGYSYIDNDNIYHASGTVSLIETKSNQFIIVDTGGCFDKEKLLKSLKYEGLEPEIIDIVVCTHSHSDHIGNLNLFPNALQIIEKEINIGDIYKGPILKDKNIYDLIPGEIQIWNTPGHTFNDISVIVINGVITKTEWQGIIACVGDLYEHENDEKIWEKNTLNYKIQKYNRELIWEKVDIIVPGHGDVFRKN